MHLSECTYFNSLTINNIYQINISYRAYVIDLRSKDLQITKLEKRNIKYKNINMYGLAQD